MAAVMALVTAMAAAVVLVMVQYGLVVVPFGVATPVAWATWA
jgi:hypothetical protein